MSARLLVQEADGRVVERAPQELSEVRDRPAWLHVVDPGSPDVALVAEELGLHPLAVEDVRERHQRPKIEQYGDHYFLVVYAIERGARDAPRQHEVEVFLARNVLVTVCDAEFPGRGVVEQSWREGRIRSTALLLHALLDVIVDGYFPALDRIEERIDTLEEAIVAGRSRPRGSGPPVRQLFAVKRALLRVRQHLAPQRDVVAVLLRDELGLFGRDERAYLQDVYDHVVRVTDEIDIARDIASSAIDAHLAAASNRLNEVVKVLTAIATVLLVVTVITGFFGMNFNALPFDSPLALWLTVAVMVAVSGGLVAFFRRLGWL